MIRCQTLTRGSNGYGVSVMLQLCNEVKRTCYMRLTMLGNRDRDWDWQLES